MVDKDTGLAVKSRPEVIREGFNGDTVEDDILISKEEEDLEHDELADANEDILNRLEAAAQDYVSPEEKKAAED